MMKTLHILNGDSTLNGFLESGIKGDVLVWREVMSEGPVADDIYSRQFWDKRSAFICENFNAHPENYRQKVLGEIALLKNVPVYDDVVLWFEFDLHCQVNMLAILQLIRKHDLSGTTISLVCPHRVIGVKDFRGLGELSGAQLADLYLQKKQLTKADLEFSAKAWKAYSSGDAFRMREFLLYNFQNLPLLKPAFEAHLKRTEKNEHGYNHIEQKLIDLWLAGNHTQNELYAGFTKTEKIFGMGDAELKLYIRRLQKLGVIDPTD